ncbi:MAG TPA: UDP-N-acetylmuramoyl-L-alanine--D-glutamate ligase [Dokdonella sp.]|uniref:UDP-N-acetylmuramoyl-L-alanine--D-glutamate ligase n=1 Tax=Dokdonella sp. TaxID=2291710 RepID=UPI0025C45A7D|nr:UDP-N-acetylmuramoyl-L-alanine--D-glutamate ligase [Dokdonella sp.]MBX3692251.1 UDP-N-acetylmuramoyl-L-alanine--D-glutamate ligase [Dokdonella sp.]MCW5567979.1 UDP-N-acetylmuramoyl-L-alanine--D-glutamate ligase [Dokdonella sp.]HNR92863.1 UDP-N-acetylmuramoyl-L-alanine--D-glutamate ligase [Dokdonella sp.]
MRLAELAGLRVAIWGLGREGRAALAALRARVPTLVPSVFCTAQEAAAAAHDGAVRVIGAPPSVADLSAFDVVIKSPGISAYRPELIEARRNGTRFTSGTALWFAEHPQARVIAVTGTKGKSTTSALIAHLLRARGRRVALAGNIGLPLLDLLDPAQVPDWWVIELSSFQTREVPHVELAVVTSLVEEHLDWHGDRDRYVDDKLALVGVAGCLVVNACVDELVRRTATHPARRLFGAAAGWHVGADALMCGTQTVFARAGLAVPGAHNALNACAALTVLDAVGEDAVAAAPALATFRPLPHRLQHLGARDGVDWIDDSIATTPAATLEALRSLTGKAVVLLVGGYDRGLDWSAFATALRDHAPQAVIANGANRARIVHELHRAGVPNVHGEATLAAAIVRARELARPGAAILLSPGAPSFDQFGDYAERGAAFAVAGGFDPRWIGQIEGLGIH